MGVAIVGPGERIGEHYHPYSEEFVFFVTARLKVDLDGEHARSCAPTRA